MLERTDAITNEVLEPVTFIPTYTTVTGSEGTPVLIQRVEEMTSILKMEAAGFCETLVAVRRRNVTF
jgi:hypothetical protein